VIIGDRIRFMAWCCGMVAMLTWIPDDTCAQDMEPRAYSAVPIDTNFLLWSYLRTIGTVPVDPTLPIANVKISVNAGVLSYNRTLDLMGRAGSVAIAVPFFQGEISADVFDRREQVSRQGLGDIRVRISENLVGNPALTPSEFALRQPDTTLGVSLTVTAPTGDYDPRHLANIGSHRWVFRPEIGVSQPIGNWFTDAAAGVWLFTDNANFFLGHVRGEDPLWVIQAHAGYNFRPDLWLAVDATRYTGGETILDGTNKNDSKSVFRMGATLSVPVSNGLSAKASWATWLTAHNGGKYDILSLTLQYRCFGA
jgi:outer membrane putative beta-barrel porin/alpha-amylase